jgi:3-hydroxymyristoyl/3-hydroxydecanoyl-(acyl carrier protein) dehydratase
VKGAGSESLCFQVTFDPALPLFVDHFPGAPLVPAFLQIQRVGACMVECLGIEPTRIKVRSAKFLQPLQPGVTAQLVIEPRGTSGGAFALSVSGVVVTQGELTVS